MDITVRKETATGLENRSWLRNTHGVDANASITLDLTLFVAATHYPDGYIRSGMVLAQVSGTGLYGPYDGAATDGRQTARGHLYSSEQVNTGSTRAGAALLRHGFVVEANLPTNHGLTAAAKTDLAGKIQYE